MPTNLLKRSVTGCSLSCQAMGDTFVNLRRLWKPTRGRSSLQASSRLLSWLSRHGGFLALAALAGAALVQQNGYLSADFGNSKQVTARPWSNVTAIDGDSLRAANEEIRLVGIDAPELFQTCRDERGGEWACGREAHALLRAFLSHGRVECAAASKDRYGRTLAICSAGPVIDVGEAMVRAGYAVDFMSGGYRGAEAEARAEKRGIWRGTFERPQDWRRRNPQGSRH